MSFASTTEHLNKHGSDFYMLNYHEQLGPMKLLVGACRRRAVLPESILDTLARREKPSETAAVAHCRSVTCHRVAGKYSVSVEAIETDFFSQTVERFLFTFVTVFPSMSFLSCEHTYFSRVLNVV